MEQLVNAKRVRVRDSVLQSQRSSTKEAGIVAHPHLEIPGQHNLQRFKRLPMELCELVAAVGVQIKTSII